MFDGSNIKILARHYVSSRVYELLWTIKDRLVKNRALLSFLWDTSFELPLAYRLHIIKQAYFISSNVASPHTHAEILSFIGAILSLPSSINGVVVEAGCYKGSSTAKFSLAADLAGRELVVFDSFRGIPKNNEGPAFKEGDYWGTLDEVRANVARFGRIGCCRFVPGWFEDTMPGFKEPIAAIYMDMDLASSTQTCLKFLYPFLQPGGVLYSQDGHISKVIAVFDNDHFWLNEVGYKKPQIQGLRKNKLIKIVKEA